MPSDLYIQRLKTILEASIDSSDVGGASWWVGLAIVQRLKCIDGHRLGPRKVAVIRSRQVAVDQGFLKHCGEWRCVLDPRRVAADQGWSLRGIPLYTVAIKNTCSEDLHFSWYSVWNRFLLLLVLQKKKLVKGNMQYKQLSRIACVIGDFNTVLSV